MISVSAFKNVLELLDYFKDDETCKQYLEQKRWKDGVCCPKCGNKKIYRTNRGYRCADRACATKFSVTVGTIMENSKIKLRYWFAAMFLITTRKKGVSSHQLAEDLGICQKSAWFMSHRIRAILADNEKKMLKSVVAADESFIGGKNKNRHKNKKVPNSQGRSTADKTPVVGLLEQGGKILTFVVPDTSQQTLQPILEKYVEEGTTLMTDEWNGYNKAKSKFDHKIVNHSAKQFVDGMVHVNGVENYWSHLKRAINGTHHWVSRKHLERYSDEMSYRFNFRSKTNYELFDQVLTHTNGRLTWDNLVGQ